jgi:branched-chain amino acid transport system permease protein
MPDFWFFLEVLVGGLLSGTMYALVALGFVLIYKASSVFNFAQGAMVFFAVLSFVGFMELGLPFWAALPVTVGLMILVGMGTERFVLRPLVNQSEDTLLMATIGLAFVIEGVAQLAWGVDVRRLDLGIRDEPINWVMDKTGMLVSQLDVTAAAVAGIMVAALALLFSHTKVGRGLRAVADDHAAALSIGIPLKHIWMLVWATAGVVALVAGMGRAQRRSVRAGVGRAQGLAGTDHRRLYLGPGRHPRRPDRGRGRKARRSLHRPVLRRRHRRMGPVHACSPFSADPA